MADELPSHELRLEQSAQRQLDRVPQRDWRRVDRRIRSLAHEPRSRRSLKLKGKLDRTRVGNWRVFYVGDDSRRLVLVTDVLRREKDTYDDL